MRVSIFGAGYVGLVTGACLAEKGHDVICVDVLQARVDQMNAGESPIYEPGLDELLGRHAGSRLRATTDAHAAVLDTELTMIAVGTPFDGSSIDLSDVKTCAESIGRALAEKSDYHTVVVKSTVVPGTTEGVIVPILERSSGGRAGEDFGVGMNPEFLTEGEAISDFMQPDRIVIGAIDERSRQTQAALYATFADVPTVCTNPATAEMIKYASNALLATMISFSNELANLGAAVGSIDIVDVMEGLHSSRYLSCGTEDGGGTQAPITSFLMAGCGFGGSCLPKDVSALVAHGRSRGLSMDLLASVLAVNANQPTQVFRLLNKHFPTLTGRRITVLGLAFRPDTNDIRESPSIPIIRRLVDEGALVTAYDPVVGEEAKGVLGEDVLFSSSLEAATEGADGVVLVTRWKEFEHVPHMLASHRHAPVVIDGRRMLGKDSVDLYEGIGL